ncbi:TIGR03643 family protein [Pseudomonadales bacterium]|nr:TIGR03643 family protein [Pseudomonadales bacterium]
MAKETIHFTESELSRIVEMAWEDRTPFEALEQSFSLNESAVIRVMRSQVKPRSFRLWRQRVTRRKTKHLMLCPEATAQRSTSSGSVAQKLKMPRLINKTGEGPCRGSRPILPRMTTNRCAAA